MYQNIEGTPEEKNIGGSGVKFLRQSMKSGK
jgi:hypothetical protein